MAKEQADAPSESGVVGRNPMGVHVLHQKRNQGLGDKEHPWSPEAHDRVSHGPVARAFREGTSQCHLELPRQIFGFKGTSVPSTASRLASPQ